MLEVFDVGPCEDAHQMGFLIGRRFSTLIKNRVATDLILQHQLIPFAQSLQSRQLIQELSAANRKNFPRYWDEMVGTAEGSGVSLLDILLLNFRKEILPFVIKKTTSAATDADTTDDCSDVLVVNESMAIAAHNEDANVALVGHVYLIRAKMSNGLSFTAYTYAGELPSCAFGFNSHGLAFTLNSVPPLEEEIMAGRIGRNFISRDLLESSGLNDALNRIRSPDVSVGHSYNLIDVRNRKIMNVETASRNRISVHEVGAIPFFHANMYLHLQVKQAHDDNSINRQRRAAQLPKQSMAEILSLLGDSLDDRYPIYMQGISSGISSRVIQVNGPSLTWLSLKSYVFMKSHRVASWVPPQIILIKYQVSSSISYKVLKILLRLTRKVNANLRSPNPVLSTHTGFHHYVYGRSNLRILFPDQFPLST